MTLREQLKRAVATTETPKVARCMPYAMQHATFEAGSATTSETPAQQPPAKPHGIRPRDATAYATSMQQEVKSDAALTPKKEAESCTRVASELAAQRVMRKLLAAAMRACDHFHDNDAQRKEMRRDVLATPPEDRAALLAHFTKNYPKEAE